MAELHRRSGGQADRGTVPSIVNIPIDDIRRRADARPLDSGTLDALEASIAEVGLINPIRVRHSGDGYEIVAGHHRFAACDLNGWREIPCILVEDDDLRAELSMIDENLCRWELSTADRANQTARRKAIYLQLHPETAAGISQAAGMNAAQGRSSGQVGHDVQRFDIATAKATGQSERAVRRDAERGEKIIPEALNLIKGTKHDTGVYLDKIKKLSPNDQVAAVKRDLAWEARKQVEPPPDNSKVRPGGIAGQIQQKPEPTYEELRSAILFLADLKPDDYSRLCPPAKRAAMCQKLSHLERVFEQVREAVSA